MASQDECVSVIVSMTAWSLAAFGVRSRCSLRGTVDRSTLNWNKEAHGPALRPPAASLRHAGIDTMTETRAPTIAPADVDCYNEMRNVPIFSRDGAGSA